MSDNSKPTQNGSLIFELTDLHNPHTITLAQSEAILEAGRTGTYEDHEAAMRAAGIEVVDDE